jgi:transcriptional regulator with XRE-family HTH domain
MQSRRKTTVAVLRQELDLTVEEFAKLIGKSLTTVNSLETGRLKLSEETAFRIQQETGVEMSWLLKGKSKEKPYIFDGGLDRPYRKEDFEITQAQKKASAQIEGNPDRFLIDALKSVTEWISICTAARRTGKGYLAHYLMTQFLQDLSQRLGKDTKAAFQMNKKALVIANDGSKWFFTAYGDHLTLFEEQAVLTKPPKK